MFMSMFVRTKVNANINVHVKAEAIVNVPFAVYANLSHVYVVKLESVPVGPKRAGPRNLIRGPRK